MAQHYSDPNRAVNPHALPDLETFYIRNAALRRHHHGKDQYWSDEMQQEPGWYYWSCFPGCLPDSEPMGPFASEQDALDDAQDDNDEEENV